MITITLHFRVGGLVFIEQTCFSNWAYNLSTNPLSGSFQGHLARQVFRCEQKRARRNLLLLCGFHTSYNYLVPTILCLYTYYCIVVTRVSYNPTSWILGGDLRQQ